MLHCIIPLEDRTAVRGDTQSIRFGMKNDFERPDDRLAEWTQIALELTEEYA